MKRNAEEIFNEAVEVTDPGEQAKYLDEACAGDEKLRAEVDALLKWHAEAGDFLEVPPVDPDVTVQTSAVEGSGTVIGRYKLLEKVGEGGMATVYMAEQKRPIRRRVALKIIKLGMDTKQVIGRFEAERQALAMMDHPNVAKVLDAGTTETGRPYFVMELVRGLPITEFCDKNHLTPQERLQLFITVCQAVQHAHQRGIIHRDIKPSNIMVTLHDGVPVVKVIDFGIAKAVNQQLTEKTVFTRYSQMIGTPEYMSPEQAEMSGLDIDTRTDVFSLGVLLYELLTGATPFDSEYLLSKGYSEMQRIIREEEPIRPSTKVSTLGEALTEVAKHRRTSPEILCKLMRTDLDWIVMKTLEKDRSRRYESVSELAADIKRHLDNEPVLAGRPSTVYRIQKFVKRNRLLVTSAAVIAAILVIATTVSLWQMVRANRAAGQLGRERDRAVKAELSARTAMNEARAAQETAAQERDHARLNLYAADMKSVQQNLDSGNLGAAQKLLKVYEGHTGEDDVRGWEWRYLWKKASGDYEQRFHGHEHRVNAVAFSPDGQLLASGSEDQSVIVRGEAGKILFRQTTKGTPDSVSFSRDGAYLAAGTNAGEVLVWGTKDFKRFKHFADQDNGSARVAFSPSDSMLAIVYGNGLVRLWNYTADGGEAWLGESNEGDQAGEHRGKGEVGGCALAFSSDGTYLAGFASGTGRFEVWDIKSSERVATLDEFQGASFAPWQHVTFVPGRSALFLGDSMIGSVLWDFQVGSVTVPVDRTVAAGISEAVFTSDGAQMITAGYDHTVRIWEVSEPKFHEEACLLGHTSEVWCVAIGPQDTRLATGGMDDDVLIWKREPEKTMECISKPFGPCTPLFSNNEELIALQGGRAFPDFWTLFYDLETGRFLETHVDGWPLCFSDDEAEIVLLKGMGIARWNLVKSAFSEERDVWSEAVEPCSMPAFCESRGLFAVGRVDGSVTIASYQESTKPTIWNAHEGPVGGVTFSPDGLLILTAEANSDTVKSSAIVWSCSDLDNIEQRYEIEGHRSHLFSGAFSPDGQILATGGVDGRILLWETATGNLRHELVGQKEWVPGLAFAPDGKTLASGSSDGTVRLWHVATGRELVTLHLDYPANWITFSPSGRTLAATCGPHPITQEELHIWQAPPFEEIDKAERSPLAEPSR